MLWLLNQSTYKNLESARENATISLAQQNEFESEYVISMSDSSRILSNAGDTAAINVKGVLTQDPDIFAAFFGGGNTTYSEINRAIALANSDDRISEISMYIDSPGGTFAGQFSTIKAMRESVKPIHVLVDNEASSAAYALAAQASSITASNPSVMVGSVGVVQGFLNREDVTEVTSTDAPNKRPDVKTDSGMASVKKELDAVHTLFVDAIAKGRDTSISDVNKNFGRGGSFLAEEAKSRGMIDNVVAMPEISRTQKTNQTGVTMNLNELKEKHSELYAQAKQEGITLERDRVCAHLTMGTKSGDMKTASAAIESGSEMTASIQAKYMSAHMDRNAISLRQSESDEAISATGILVEAEKVESEDEKVMALIEKKLGVEK
jgi:ClpP class serine protease